MSPEIAAAVNNTPQPFVEGSQVDTSPQLTTAETEAGGIVGPGQEHLIEELEREQSEAQQEEAILGKFKSPQELAKAYAELQRKMGQQSGDQPAEAAEAEPDAAPLTPSESYTTEAAMSIYGKEAVENLAEKGVNLNEVMWQADQGQDISQHYDTLAETFQVPRQVVENYVQKAQASEASSGEGLSDADATSIQNAFGGEEGFADLAGWAKANMNKAELVEYNSVVDSGNKEAIMWALKAMQARRQAPDAVVEPQLYGGGAPTDTVVRFESQQQVLDAMNKKNDRGQRLYDVDEAYRNKVAMILNSSSVF